MAYAAVTSLGQTLDQIMHHDRRVSLYDEKVFRSLRRTVSSLQNFLEECPQGVDRFEILAAKIRDAAYEVENIIEIDIWNFKGNFGILELAINSYVKALVFLQIMMPFSCIYECGIKFTDKMFRWPYCYSKLLFGKIDVLCVEAKRFRGRCSLEQGVLSRDSLPAGPSRLNFRDNIVPVGLDEDLLTIKDRLTSSESRLVVVPIVGMGGIGKTTLADSIYRDSLIVNHFDIRAWITVSQIYNVRGVLLQLFNSLGKLNEKMLTQKEDGLREHLHKTLFGRRYLIVMDDLWSTDAWDCFRMYFPDNDNGSRIVLTTRLETVAIYASSGSPLHHLDVLSDFESWDLLRGMVFGEESCPSRLSELGQQIASDCRGLPLTVVVMAGLLSKVNRTPDEWEKVAEDLHSVADKDSDPGLDTLLLSYNHLPQHLKACFLYMGVFPEDSKISVSKVIKLWAAEGFLKQNEDKTLEELAEEYILELAERNLISVFGKRGQKDYSSIKTIRIHDLLRELCIRESRKEKFLHVIRRSIDGVQQDMKDQRHVCIYPDIPIDDPCFACLNPLVTPILRSISVSYTRSLLYTGWYPIPSYIYNYFMLLRVLDISQVPFFEFPMEILVLCNLRYLAFSYHGEVPESISKLWNLQTLIIFPSLKNFAPCARPLPLAIWSMPQLRHLRFHVWYLSDFPCLLPGWKTCAFLANLQTLLEVHASVCQKQVLQEMPNLKKLGIWMETWDAAPFSINSLACLQKLKVLKCSVRSFPTQEVLHFPDYDSTPKIAFPPGLKELSLASCRISWKDISIVGSLPNLERLKLRDYAFVGPEWEPTEGEFSRLNFLYIDGSDLVHWKADSSHFPLLRHLIVENCPRLQAIPSDIGEIPTLQIIEIDKSSSSAVNSAKEIEKEQQDMGNYGLHVRINGVAMAPRSHDSVSCHDTVSYHDNECDHDSESQHECECDHDCECHRNCECHLNCDHCHHDSASSSQPAAAGFLVRVVNFLKDRKNKRK